MIENYRAIWQMHFYSGVKFGRQNGEKKITKNLPPADYLTGLARLT